MAYRFTNTDKWADGWFSQLPATEKLLFLYLIDNCDIAGFIEVNFDQWAFSLKLTKKDVEGACKGLARGLTFSSGLDAIFVNNFLKHQKNLPLNENNKSHIGILKRFDLYRNKFDIQDINQFIEGACKGLLSPTGNGIGIGKGKKEKPVSKKTSFSESEFFDKKKFKEAISEWGNDKLAYYYNSANAWSKEGNKKIDWIATVKNWAARDEKEGKIKFADPNTKPKGPADYTKAETDKMLEDQRNLRGF